MNKTQNKQSAFTIVELLIVIVVVGILATISVSAYGGMQKRAQNAKLLGEHKTIIKAFELYKAANGSVPSVPLNTRWCVGHGYRDADGDGQTDCTDVQNPNNRLHPNAALNAQLEELQSLPNTPYNAGALVGVYVSYRADPTLPIRIFQAYLGESGECPDGMSENYAGSGMVECYAEVQQ